MALLSDAIHQEHEMQREEMEKARGKGRGAKTSITEAYLDERAASADKGEVSPDSLAATQGLRAPKNILRRS